MAQTAEEKRISNNTAVAEHHKKLMLFKVQPYKEEGQVIKDYANAAGLSAQKLFLEAVREYMIRHPVKLETPKKEEPAEVLPKEEEKPMEEPKQEPEEESTPEVLVSPFEFHEACVFALVFPDFRFIGATKDLGNDLKKLDSEISKNSPGRNKLLNEYANGKDIMKVELLEVLYDVDSNHMKSRCDYYKKREEEKT